MWCQRGYLKAAPCSGLEAGFQPEVGQPEMRGLHEPKRIDGGRLLSL